MLLKTKLTKIIRNDRLILFTNHEELLLVDIHQHSIRYFNNESVLAAHHYNMTSLNRIWRCRMFIDGNGIVIVLLLTKNGKKTR